MNKLKILLTTMAIVIVSCVTCFADEKEIRASFTSPKGNTFSYLATYKSEGIDYSLYANSKPYLRGDGYVVVNGGSEWEFYKNGNYWTKGNSFATFGIDDESTFKVRGDIIVPPTIAPTVEQAIMGIIPTFSNQLVEFLPIGITILAVLLGVQLIPRLVAWFQ